MSKNGIEIKGSVHHQAEVTSTLEKIYKNIVGSALILLIEKESETVTIVPFDQKHVNAVGGCNAAGSKPTSGSGWAPKGIQPYKGNGDNIYTTRDERHEKFDYTGTGEGSDVEVYFSAGMLNASECHQGRFGREADVILFHELVHALRYMQGLAENVPTPTALKDYRNEEEFLAINIANVYMSVGGSTLLRAGHDDKEQLPPDRITSAGFLADTNNLAMMNKLLTSWPAMFEALSGIRAQFNPFAEVFFRSSPSKRPPAGPPRRPY